MIVLDPTMYDKITKFFMNKAINPLNPLYNMIMHIFPGSGVGIGLQRYVLGVLQHARGKVFPDV